MREKHTQQRLNWEEDKLGSRNQRKCWLASENSVKFVHLFLREANRVCPMLFILSQRSRTFVIPMGGAGEVHLKSLMSGVCPGVVPCSRNCPGVLKGLNNANRLKNPNNFNTAMPISLPFSIT